MHVHVDSWIDTVNIQNVFYTKFEQPRHKSEVSVLAKFVFLCLTLRLFIVTCIRLVLFVLMLNIPVNNKVGILWKRFHVSLNLYKFDGS